MPSLHRGVQEPGDEREEELMAKGTRILYLIVSGCHKCPYRDRGYEGCILEVGELPVGGEIDTYRQKTIPEGCPLPKTLEEAMK